MYASLLCTLRFRYAYRTSLLTKYLLYFADFNYSVVFLVSGYGFKYLKIWWYSCLDIEVIPSFNIRLNAALFLM